MEKVKGKSLISLHASGEKPGVFQGRALPAKLEDVMALLLFPEPIIIISDIKVKRIRNNEHMFKSNNWLKLHGKPMRRKPFERELSFLGDKWNIKLL